MQGANSLLELLLPHFRIAALGRVLFGFDAVEVMRLRCFVVLMSLLVFVFGHD